MNQREVTFAATECWVLTGSFLRLGFFPMGANRATRIGLIGQDLVKQYYATMLYRTPIFRAVISCAACFCSPAALLRPSGTLGRFHARTRRNFGTQLLGRSCPRMITCECSIPNDWMQWHCYSSIPSSLSMFRRSRPLLPV